MNNQKALEYFYQGDYEVALKKIKHLLQNTSIDPKKRMELTKLKIRILIENEQINEAEKEIEKTRNALLKKEKPDEKKNTDIIDLEILKAEAYWARGELSEARKILSETKKKLEKINSEDNSGRWARIFFRESAIEILNKNYEKAFKKLMNSVELFKNNGEIKWLSMAYNNLGFLYERKNEYDKAVRCYKKSLELKKRLKNDIDFAKTLFNLGKTYVLTGNFRKGLKILEESANIFEKKREKKYIPIVLNEIGVVYLLRGELDSAEAIFFQIKKIREKKGQKHLLAPILINLGMIYFAKNNLDKAKENYLEALDIAKENNYWETAGLIYFNLVEIEIKKNNLEQSFYFLKEIEKLSKEKKLEEINQDYLLSKALFLKHSSRLKDKAEAQKILEKIAAKKETDITRKTSATIYLLDLLFEEYRAFGDNKPLEEIDEWIVSLKKVAREQQSYDLIAQLLILEGKISIIRKKLDEAEAFLSQAQAIAEEKGLFNLSLKCSILFDELTEAQAKNNEENTKVIEKIGFKELLTDTLYKGRGISLEIEAEIPVAFIIMSGKGKTLFYRRLGEHKEFNNETINKFLPIITRSSPLILKNKEKVGRISLGEYVVLILKLQKIFLVYIIKGASFSAVQKLKAIRQVLEAKTKKWEWLSVEEITPKTEDIINLNHLIGEILKIEPIETENIQKEEIMDEELPSELLKFKKIFHPVKLSILNVLNKNYRLAMSDLRKLLGIPWGNLETHLSKLINEGLIEKRTEFVGDKVKEILYINTQGVEQYFELKKALEQIL